MKKYKKTFKQILSDMLKNGVEKDEAENIREAFLYSIAKAHQLDTDRHATEKEKQDHYLFSSWAGNRKNALEAWELFQNHMGGER